MTAPPNAPQTKSLAPRQAWFLGVMALAVIFMFAFVILPYVDPPAPRLSGQQLSDFDLELLNGGQPGDRIRLSDLRGKTVVLDFWASWCGPCREQASAISELASQVGEDVYVLGINTSDERQDALAFIEKHAPRYPNAFDVNSQLARHLQVTSLPTLMIVDAHGTLRVMKSQVFSAAELAALVKGVAG